MLLGIESYDTFPFLAKKHQNNDKDYAWTQFGLNM
jgi:hypothetical protein